MIGKSPKKTTPEEILDFLYPELKDELSDRDIKLIKLIEDLIPEPIPGEPGKTPTDSELQALIKPLIPKVKDGVDGKDGLNGLDGLDGKDGVDGKDGKNGSPDKGIDIIKKINELPATPESQIDASHIKNLPLSIKKYSSGGGGLTHPQVMARLSIGF